MRKRLERSFARFIDVRERSDRDIAQLAGSMGIDIAVDLAGFTRRSNGSRPRYLTAGRLPDTLKRPT